MFTRQDYLDRKCTHQEYYAQMVTPEIIRAVLARFTLDELREAFKNDQHFNSIRLSEWDGIGAMHKHYLDKAPRAYGDFGSLAGRVCIVKAAARMLVEKGD